MQSIARDVGSMRRKAKALMQLSSLFEKARQVLVCQPVSEDSSPCDVASIRNCTGEALPSVLGARALLRLALESLRAHFCFTLELSSSFALCALNLPLLVTPRLLALDPIQQVPLKPKPLRIPTNSVDPELPMKAPLGLLTTLHHEEEEDPFDRARVELAYSLLDWARSEPDLDKGSAALLHHVDHVG